MFRAGLVIILMLGATTSRSEERSSRVDYATQVKPILSHKCYACHGALKQQSGLRLETRALMLRGGDGGAVVVPGSSVDSVLVQRIMAGDDQRMPPTTDGSPLTADEISLIRRWIDQGASAPEESIPIAAAEHWAFQPITRPALPAINDPAWCKNPIDAFLARQHHRMQLSPQTAAPRIVQLRRLYFDLVGIPPTAAEIDACEDDKSPMWYERTVDRLLDDPRHGERWARHWMDIWRYSDWWGLGEQLRRSQKHIWHWRDWIVESLNHDTPYDEMVRLMLAADELHPNDLDKLRATGFLARNWWLFNRDQWMDETVEHVGKGLLGLTFDCAKCHDHKYDPIEQSDYYAMRAFFEPYHVRLDVVPGETDLTRNGIPRVYDGWLDKPTYRYVRGQEQNPDKSKIITPGVPKQIELEQLTIQPVDLPQEAWQPGYRSWVIEAHLTKARRSITTAETSVARARENLADMEKRATDLPTQSAAVREQTRLNEQHATNQTQPAVSTEEAARAIAVAELTAALANLEAANATRESVEQRAAAMRADSDAENEMREAAVRAERAAAVAQAAHSVAVAELERLRAADDQQSEADKKLKECRDALAAAMSAVDAEVTETDQYAELVGAQWIPTRFLHSSKDDPTVEFAPHSTGRRTALAKWITDHRHPLTARVAVNHIWMRHMGQPLVTTVSDFGRNGTRPTHPELLDWLAAQWIERGWSMKHLHRLIVTSAAYRMNSTTAGCELNVERDPDNRYWWRRNPMRLESQLVRDSIIAHAGTVDARMGGPPVPSGEQNSSRRRSLYFFHSNNDRNQFLTTFDEALVTECYRREQSIVPQQALALTNSELVLDAAPKISERLSVESADDTVFVRRAFSVLLGIHASDQEIAASVQALADWRHLPGNTETEARARLVWSLINHNDFVTLR